MLCINTIDWIGIYLMFEVEVLLFEILINELYTCVCVCVCDRHRGHHTDRRQPLVSYNLLMPCPSTMSVFVCVVCVCVWCVCVRACV